MMRVWFVAISLALVLSLCPAYAENAAEDTGVLDATAMQEAFRRSFDDMCVKLERLASRYAETDPAKAEVCREALKFVREKMLADTVKRIDELVAQRRLNLAAEEAAGLINALREILAILEGTRDLDARMNELADMMEKIEGLIEAQVKLSDETKALEGPDERKGEDQFALSREAADIAKSLEEASYMDSAAFAKAAADNMRSAANSVSAGKKEDATASQSDAVQNLRDALEAARRAQEMLEALKAYQELSKLKEQLALLREQQVVVLGMADELAGIFEQNGKLNRAQMVKLSSAARQQKDLSTEFGKVADGLDAAGKYTVFAFLMKRNTEDSTSAAETMTAGTPERKVPRKQRDIIRRIDVILKAIEDAMTRIRSGEAGGGGGGGGQSGKKIPLEQIIALREEQASVAGRTREILLNGEKADAGELEELRARQQECADLLYRLMEDAQ